jgi:hypothetical protein
MSRIVPMSLLATLLYLAPPATAGVASQLYDTCLFPAVASAPGQGGTYFRTDVTLVNPYVYHPVEIQTWLLKNDQDNSAAEPVSLTLQPGETVVVRDIVKSMFNFTGGASLWMSSTNGYAFGCNARTYTGTGSTYGFSGNGHYWNNVGGSEIFTSGLRNGNGYRTNLGLMSTSAIPITVEVTIFGSAGSLGNRSISLPPFGRTQFSVSEIAPAFDNAYAIWYGVTDSEEATWIPFATVIDNASGDSVYIDDVYDRAFSLHEATVDLSGEWQGSAVWSGGSRNITALLYQAGPRVEGGLYDSDSGVFLTYLTGSEHQGGVQTWGSGQVLACLADTVEVSGTVQPGGNALSLTVDGTGCFSPAAALVLQRQVGASRTPAGIRSLASPAPRSKVAPPKPRASRAGP